MGIAGTLASLQASLNGEFGQGAPANGGGAGGTILINTGTPIPSTVDLIANGGSIILNLGLGP